MWDNHRIGCKLCGVRGKFPNDIDTVLLVEKPRMTTSEKANESEFDSLYNTVKKVCESGDFLARFGKLQTDKDRFAEVIGLPEVAKFRIGANFQAKSWQESERKRTLGNTFSLQDNEEALRLYTEAILCAPHPPSLSLASRKPGIRDYLQETDPSDKKHSLAFCYADRSSTLVQLKEHYLAIADIQRALSHGYPVEDCYKLLFRMSQSYAELGDYDLAESTLNQAILKLRECSLDNASKAKATGELVSHMKSMRKDKAGGVSKVNGRNFQKDFKVPSLFKARNEKLPFASSAVKLCYSAQQGRHLIAVQDIKPGSIVIVDQPYAWTLEKEFFTKRCLHCCHIVIAPIPCYHCSTVCFCDEDCRDAAWVSYHQYECLVFNHFSASRELSRMALLTYRVVCMTGMEILHKTFAVSSLSVEDDVVSSSEYNSVYNQVTNSELRPAGDLLKRATTAAFLLACLRAAAFFEGTEVETKSAELVAGTALLRHLQSCSCNAYEINAWIGEDIRSAEGVNIGGAVYPTISLTNHSCDPNVVRHSFGKTCVVRTTRTVRKGEQLYDNYGYHFIACDKYERRGSLKQQYFFECQCTPCVEDWPLYESIKDKPTVFKCPHCSERLGCNLIAMKNCFNCQKKIDNRAVGKRLQALAKSYSVALDLLLRSRFEESLSILLTYIQELERVVVHPCKEFIACQEAIKQCWNLAGNREGSSNWS